MRLLLLVIFVLLVSCEENSPDHTSLEKLEKSVIEQVKPAIKRDSPRQSEMEKVFAAIDEQRLPIRKAIAMWETFLFAFKEESCHTPKENYLRKKAQSILEKLYTNREQRRLRREEYILRKNEKNNLLIDDQKKQINWRKVVEPVYGASYIVDPDWESKVQVNDSSQIAIQYWPDRYGYIHFDFFKVKKLHMEELVQNVSKNFFSAYYSSYVPVKVYDFEINGFKGKCANYLLKANRSHTTFYVKAFFGNYNNNLYTCYYLYNERTSKSSLKMLVRSFLSLRIKRTKVNKIAKKWTQITLPQHNFTYRVRNEWQVKNLNKDKFQHIVMYQQGNFYIGFMWVQNPKKWGLDEIIKINFSWANKVTLISKKDHQINSFKGKYVKCKLEATMKNVEHLNAHLFHCFYKQYECFVYYMCPAKDNIQQILQNLEESMHSIALLSETKANIQSIPKTVQLKNFPVTYVVPKSDIIQVLQNDADEFYSIYNYDNKSAVLSFHCWRNNQEKPDKIHSDWQRVLLQAYPSAIKNQEKEINFGNLKGQLYTYEYHDPIARQKCTSLCFISQFEDMAFVLSHWFYNDKAQHYPLFVQFANSIYLQKSLQKQILYYSKVIKKNPDYALGYYLRGKIFAKRRQWKRAIDDYTTAIDNNFLLTKAFENRAIAWRQLKHHQNSISDSRVLLAIKNYHPDFEKINEYIDKHKDTLKIPKSDREKLTMYIFLKNQVSSLVKILEFKVLKEEYINNVQQIYSHYEAQGREEKREFFVKQYIDKIIIIGISGWQQKDIDIKKLKTISPQLKEKIRKYHNKSRFLKKIPMKSIKNIGMYKNNKQLKIIEVKFVYQAFDISRGTHTKMEKKRLLLEKQNGIYSVVGVYQ